MTRGEKFFIYIVSGAWYVSCQGVLCSVPGVTGCGVPEGNIIELLLPR